MSEPRRVTASKSVLYRALRAALTSKTVRVLPPTGAQPKDAATCPQTSRTLEGWSVLTCRLPVGHDGPHVDPPSEQFSCTGFWWDKP